VSVLFVFRYQDRLESEWIVSATAILGLTFTIVTVLTVPADIFMVSSTLDAEGQRRPWATTETLELLKFYLRIVYYSLYSTLIFFSFVLIPFVYFYFEEGDDETSTSDRVCHALKYAIGTSLLLCGLIVAGYFLTAGSKPQLDWEWFRNVWDESGGERILVFLVASMGLIGMLMYISYTVENSSPRPMEWQCFQSD
jgi:LMBR1 domain-containing protein 1